MSRKRGRKVVTTVDELEAARFRRQTIERRRYHGCEDPANCQWPRIHIFTTRTGCSADDFLALKLCDFHREAVQEWQQRNCPTMTPHGVTSLHVAAWRARR